MKQSVVTTQPQAEPLLLSYVKNILKVDHSEDDVFIQNLIVSARIWCENRTNRSFITQVRSQYQDEFNNSSKCIELLYGPLVAVSDVYVNYIKYYDENDVLQTLDSSNYWIDTVGKIPRILVKESWPSTKSRLNAVEISYNAGYGDSGTSVPGHVRSAMELYIAHFYENRVPEITGSMISRFEMGIERLLDSSVAYQNAF